MGEPDDVIAANEALELFASAITKEHGGDRKSEKIKSDNVTLDPERGNTKSYAMRRLKKDKPNIYKRVVAGEISAHAGMIEAGFRKKKISCTYDVPSIIKILFHVAHQPTVCYTTAMIKTRVPELLAEREKEIGEQLSIRRLSKEVGLDRFAVRNWKAGNMERFRATSIEAWCRYFDVDLNGLFIVDFSNKEDG